MYLHLAKRKRFPEFEFQSSTVLCGVIWRTIFHPRIVEMEPASSRGLRLIKCQIGALDQSFGGHAISWSDGDTDAGSNVRDLSADHVRPLQEVDNAPS
jgi:hypothetical protein